MSTREIARRIVAMRRLLTIVAVANAAGDYETATATLHRMDRIVLGLPLLARRDVVLGKRVREPVDRVLEREGVLAAAQRVGYRWTWPA